MLPPLPVASTVAAAPGNGPAVPVATPDPTPSISTTQADLLLRAVDGALENLDGAVVDADVATAQGE